jgi:hypothetical protein
LHSILSCFDTFEKERDSNHVRAREDLEAANKKYESLRTRSRHVRGDSILYNGIREVWSVYARYPVICQDVQCGPYTLSFCDDFKTGLEHLYAAEMVAYNLGNIVDQLGAGSDEKLNAMNERILTELGQAIAKGDYNIRSDAKQMVEDLPHLIVTERKGNGLLSEAFLNVRRIQDAYRKKNYAEALALYSRYYRFFELEEFKNNQHVVAEAKFCVGAILLWDLEGINKSADMSIPNSWLANSMKTLGIQRQTGKELLLEITRMPGLSEELYKKAYVVLGKTN